MKAIIEGKRYDTDTATEVAVVGNDYPRNDFQAWRGTLYRTPKGNWFVEGSGGPMTMFARSVGNATSGSSGIKVIDAEQAASLLEAAKEYEALEKYFGMQIEDA